jgi:hypothetical protein
MAVNGKHRRMLIAVAVTLTAAFAVWLWLNLRESPEVARARNLRIGQSSRDLLEIMGQPDLGKVLPDGSSEWYYDSVAMRLTDFSRVVYRWTGVYPLLRKDEDWAVIVRVDGHHERIDRIKRGREIIEAQ